MYHTNDESREPSKLYNIPSVFVSVGRTFARNLKETESFLDHWWCFFLDVVISSCHFDETEQFASRTTRN